MKKNLPGDHFVREEVLRNRERKEIKERFYRCPEREKIPTRQVFLHS